MKAVHFGAGNIGRGFVGLLLHEAGYEIVFADVAAELIDSLAAAESYTVHEVGQEGQDKVVTGFSALNSGSQQAEVIEQIATADLVTTAVGPHILKFVAPAIAQALAQRPAQLAPLHVMACENAINATDILQQEIQGAWEGTEQELASRAIFANTAVDRIVPAQAPGQNLDVTVETFYEWVIDRTPFNGDEPAIPGATFVDELLPYIERKLFTVNTGHASAAYFGAAAGIEKISDAMADEQISQKVNAVLQETKSLLVTKHGLDPVAQEAYVQKILTRFTNPHLPDTVGRVGRAPMRKLSRHERFIGPAADLAERGMPTSALALAIAAALQFNAPGDEEAVALHQILESQSPDEATASITGLEPEHPLFAQVSSLIAEAV
ncbi:mannitol-1-phosphate 5-dehydrogenase [Glutamicibacter halophytocola]|uniref:Mannitol-1-phosphate 5-dehydrogenase n=1 Tax=Glutamicibacter halophytocola TaxID=1933880 RepID=A0ABX5Y8S0_9MICC|nr:mannitol-1-phosphate 5-dehydrogenase [Glutamicibacter halophytocola]QDY65861.1 mannitol-1-phosphate 5-dehydrogenase [Glutamicibacter halophytocola]